MVDFYHLFKLGTATARILKAGNGIYNITILSKSLWKPMATMGVMGIVDGAMEDATEKIIKKIEETK